MKCPHCNNDISDEQTQKYSASLAGRKSKRSLTPEQARELVNKRWKKKEPD